jgi:hypothetical protein
MSDPFGPGFAGVVGCFALNPLDCVRVRWQTATSDAANAKTIRRFVGQVIEKEGLWRGLWRPALGTNAAAVCTCNSLRFAWYPRNRFRDVPDLNQHTN